MPFLTPYQAKMARARGERVVTYPNPGPDGLTHYASTKTHLMCYPAGMQNQKGSPHWNRVTCPECLKMGKRTGRQEGGVKKEFVDMTKERNR